MSSDIARSLFLLTQQALAKLDEMELSLRDVADCGFVGEAVSTHDDLERARTALTRIHRRFVGREISHHVHAQDWRKS